MLLPGRTLRVAQDAVAIGRANSYDGQPPPELLLPAFRVAFESGRFAQFLAQQRAYVSARADSGETETNPGCGRTRRDFEVPAIT